MPHVPEDVLLAIQGHFHTVILGRAAKLIEQYNVPLPELTPLLATEVPEAWFPVPGMYGGFRYWLEGEGEQAKLVTESWCRVVDGSEQRHEITSAGSQLVFYLEGEDAGAAEVRKPRFFTHYWTKQTWESQRTRGHALLGHTASNQFRERGIDGGDFIYVITVVDGRLHLGGRIAVDRLLTQEEARERLGHDLWEADDHAIAKPGSEMEIGFDRTVSVDVTRQLRFKTGNSISAPKFRTEIELDSQTLRGVKELTPESARLLDEMLGVVKRDLIQGGGSSDRIEGGSSGSRLTDWRDVFPDVNQIVVDPPERRTGVKDGRVKERSYRAVKCDFAAWDVANREIGAQGEEFVVEYERRMLIGGGREDLAEKVCRISETKGDGAGYDVLSFDQDGGERYIEVKTTTQGRESPFYVTLNEIEFSEDHATRYCLFRVFDFPTSPKMFVIESSLREACNLEPVQFKASF